MNGGRLLALENWRFLQGDALAGENSWKLHIHRIAFENQPLQQKWVATDLHTQVWGQMEANFDGYAVRTFTTV